MLPAVPGGAQHGTRSMYVKGCRCDDCRDAEALYNRTRQARRSCRHGHRWTTENTYIDSRGRRRCRACMREANRRANAKRGHCRCYYQKCPACRLAGRVRHA